MAGEGKSVKFAEKHEEHSDSEGSNAEEDLSEQLDRQFNKFQLLDLVESAEIDNDDDDVIAGSSDDASDTETATKSVTKEKGKQNGTSNSGPQSGKKRNKRSRNKSKGGKKNSPSTNDEFDFGNSDTTQTQLVNNQSLGNDSNISKCIQGSSETHLRLLKLNMHNLLPDIELKRMFGKVILQEKSKEPKIRHAGAQRSRFSSHVLPDYKNQFQGPKMELDELFNEPKQSNQPPNAEARGGSKKKTTNPSQLEDDTKPIYFKFVHDEAYRMAQMSFLDIAESGYSEALLQYPAMFPYHAESLIQLSDAIRITEEFKTASEFIERALLTFERGFHPRFNLASGNCRLSYQRPENRSFFITIFKQIMYLNRRGLRRTPLEYTKLLLSLDPISDPLFAALLIDFFAIRSEEYDFLIEFISKWPFISKLPNMNFSLALAYFMKSKSLKNGRLVSENNLKLADESLQAALLRYPNFIIPLLDACSAEPSAELKKTDYFDYSASSSMNKIKKVPQSLDLLISLYVERTIALWKTKDVLSWLERNVATLVNKFANKELVDKDQHFEHWSDFRGPAPRNLLRHIALSDLKVKIPRDSSSGLDIDPFPPNESIVSYDIHANRQNRAHQIGGSPEDATGFSRFPTLFLRTILPSYSSSSTDRNLPGNGGQ